MMNCRWQIDWILITVRRRRSILNREDIRHWQWEGSSHKPRLSTQGRQQRTQGKEPGKRLWLLGDTKLVATNRRGEETVLEFLIDWSDIEFLISFVFSVAWLPGEKRPSNCSQQNQAVSFGLSPCECFRRQCLWQPSRSWKCQGSSTTLVRHWRRTFCHFRIHCRQCQGKLQW